MATDGAPNCNSFLYARCWTIARGMGYLTSITYTQDGESGASLRAAGYRLVRRIDARKGWAESSVKLKAKKNPVGTGGVVRFLWAISVLPWADVVRRLGGEGEEETEASG